MRKKVISFFIIILIILLSLIGGFTYKSIAEHQRLKKYPKQYEATVSSCAEKYNVPDAALYAVLKASSDFNPSYENGEKVGIYPLSSEEFCRLAIAVGENPDERLRYCPEVSIELCAYKLAQNYAKFTDKGAVFAAMFIGDEEVERNILGNNGALNTDKLDEKTQKFVKDTQKNYEKYTEIYAVTTEKPTGSSATPETTKS